MKASDYIISFLSSQGVTKIFGYIGGMVTHIVDSAYRNSSVDFIQTYHEQSAAFAAEGYAIETGVIGVAVATSGPGATNMITGIADAWFGSVPVLYITGQVNSFEYKYSKPIRQQGFQETDIVSIVKPITKYASLVDDVDKLQSELTKAITIATTGRKGPVLLDICMDVQRSDINPIGYIDSTDLNKHSKEEYSICSIIEKVCSARHPMLLVGGGVKDEQSKSIIHQFLNRTNIPVVSSLMGIGIVTNEYPYYLGLLGSYGNRCANKSMEKVDLLIAIGTRLDTRQTGAKLDSFVENGNIIRVDIDIDELQFHRLNNCINICDTGYNFIEKFLLNFDEKLNISSWLNEILVLKSTYNQTEEIKNHVKNKEPYYFLESLNRRMKQTDVVVADVGHNQMFVAQTIKFGKDNMFVTSGGLAPMGFSLPVSVGIAFGNKSRRVFSINGDGGFHMATQSLMLISQYHLPVISIILNNKSLGMITQFQNLYFDGNLYATTSDWGYKTPNFKKISEAYGLPYYQLKVVDLNNEKLLNTIFEEFNCVIEFVTDELTVVSPKLEYNKPIYCPSPEQYSN